LPAPERVMNPEIVQAVREWVEREVYPVASDYEHADEFPEPLVEQMKELGLFGVTIPEEYGGLGLDLTTYALIQVELSRGWMSLSGVLNTHFISAWMIRMYGTDEQRERYLPRMATGEIRSAYSMTEPHAGSDVQSIRTRAVREGDEWAITGQKMWATNGLRAGMMTMLAVTDPEAEPRHRGLTAFVLEKEPGAAQQPGLTISAPLKKLGYKGVESVEMSFDGFRAPANAALGGEAGIGQGFKYFMGGIELGRCNIAARAVGIAMRAFEESIRYAQEREAFGKPIAQHQAIQLKLAQMATKIEASRLLLLQAVEQKDAGQRADLEAGMAKWFATETAEEVALEAMRIHGGAGYSQELVVERIYRDAPVLILGEGSNEIQQLVIARRLLERHAI
jgi:alkylation response protein AidB-like acyl-CoA dehydrogenase